MKRILFIDRDGTILIEPPDEQIDSIDKMEFYPAAISVLNKIATELDYELVLASNQDGLGTSSFPEDTFWPVQNLMLKILKNEGIVFSDILIDPTLPSENAPTRKPGTGMFTKYMTGEYDLANSYVIGDRVTDIQLASNLKCGSILIANEAHVTADLQTKKWEEIYHFLKSRPRKTDITRNTRETKIDLSLNIDGSGKSQIETGLGFFDHMLELFSKHSLCDLNLTVRGDLFVDEHHTVEDCALVIGKAFKQALGDKKGIERYGFLLPMDESIAETAIDFSGRPHLNWQAKFTREKIGEMPTELFEHFFKSFSDSARCNLYVKAEGKNEHHLIEAIFKSVARSVKQAVRSDPYSDDIPSSKGLL